MCQSHFKEQKLTPAYIIGSRSPRAFARAPAALYHGLPCKLLDFTSYSLPSRAYTPRFCTSTFSLQPPWWSSHTPRRTHVSPRASLKKSKASLKHWLKAEGNCAMLMHIYHYSSRSSQNHPFHRISAMYIHTLCRRFLHRLKAESRSTKPWCIRARGSGFHALLHDASILCHSPHRDVEHLLRAGIGIETKDGLPQ